MPLYYSLDCLSGFSSAKHINLKRIAQKIGKDEIDAELVEKLKIIATRSAHDMSQGSEGF